MNSLETIDALIDSKGDADQIISNKEVILQIFQSFDDLPLQKIRQILFVLLNKIETNIALFGSDEILLIFNKIISKEELIKDQSLAFLLSNFIHFLVICKYISLDLVLSFTNFVLEQAFSVSEDGITITNDSLKTIGVLLIDALVKNLTFLEDKSILLKFRELVSNLLPLTAQETDENWTKIVCECIVEIFENSFECFEDNFEFLTQMLNFAKESDNLIIWDKLWTSLSVIEEKNAKSILDFSVSLFFEMRETPFAKGIFFFIANNIQYVFFEKYINEEENSSLLTEILLFIASLDSLDEYDDSLFSKVIKFASANDTEFNILIQFISTMLQNQSPTEIQIISCFSAISTLLDEKGYKLLSFQLFETEEETESDFPQENEFQSTVFSFLIENKEDLLSNPFILSEISSMIQSFSKFKEYVNRNQIQELFNFSFSCLSEIEDESFFIIFHQFLLNLVPLCEMPNLEELLPLINEQNIDILTAFLQHNIYSLSNEETTQIIQNFLPLMSGTEENVLSFFSLLSTFFSQKPFIDDISSVFIEISQTIINSLPEQDPSFICSFLQTFSESLIKAHILPAFDLQVLDVFEEQNEFHIFKGIQENVKRLKFLYSSHLTEGETNTQRFLLFKENPLIFLDILIHFPEFFSPAFLLNCNETWANINSLSEEGEIEIISSFFKSLLENGFDYCLPKCLNFFLQIPMNSNSSCQRAFLQLFSILRQNLSQQQSKSLLSIITTNAHLFGPFAVNCGIDFEIEQNFPHFFGFSLPISGSFCVLLSFHENFSEICQEMMKNTKFLPFLIENFQKNFGFEVLLLKIFASFPSLLTDAKNNEIFLSMIHNFPKNQQFSRQFFLILIQVLHNESFDPNFRIEICICLMKSLIFSDFILQERHISRNEIIRAIQETSQEIIETSLSKLDENQEIISQFFS